MNLKVFPIHRHDGPLGVVLGRHSFEWSHVIIKQLLPMVLVVLQRGEWLSAESGLPWKMATHMSPVGIYTKHDQFWDPLQTPKMWTTATWNTRCKRLYRFSLMFVQLFVAVDAKAKTTLSTSHDSPIPSICMVYLPTFGCSLPVNVGKTYDTWMLWELHPFTRQASSRGKR